MKKLLFSILIFTSALSFGAARRVRTASPAATKTTAPSKISNGFFANVAKIAAGKQVSNDEVRYATLITETASAVTLFDTLENENKLTNLPKEQRGEYLKALETLWKEAKDLIKLQSKWYYILPDNDQLKELKQTKQTIAQLVRKVAGRVESFRWEAESCVDRNRKWVTSVLAVGLAHRSGYLYSGLYNACQPKACFKALGYLILPEQLQTKAIEAVKAAPAPAGWSFWSEPTQI